jgi:two-component sensor histidine kinase
MVLREVRAFFREPRPERPPGPSGRDRRLALGLVAIAAAEGVLRDGLVLRPLHVAAGVLFGSTVAFRRTRPLGAVAAAFGLATALALAHGVLRLPEVSLYTSTCVLLLPYSLLRWGSGREIALGLAFIASAYAAAALGGEMHDPADFVGAAVVLLLPAALGASVRFRAEGHRREIEHAKLRERARLARDLHDTVAHHVSAIAIQAQAGRAVLSARPEAAARALEAIEGEAARSLSELRSMVKALRDVGDGPHVALEPQPGIADIERLASSMRSGPVVEVELDRDLDALRPAVQAALYRIAQESITNAVRHARGATRVRVRVHGEGPAVRLTVHDDGNGPPVRTTPGFGLVGMAERAELLGGKLQAGPRSEGGWTVDVVLPCDGESR